MIAVIRKELPAPAFVVVGEPTDMVAVNGHKGITYYRVTVTGREAHSSQTQLGVSAIMEAVALMASLTALSARLEREADPASPFTPKGATLTIGLSAAARPATSSPANAASSSTCAVRRASIRRRSWRRSLPRRRRSTPP